jgi:hypothetical protein
VAFATRSIAILPPAPVTFSTITALPNTSVSLSASRRATTSTPGAKPNSMRMVRSGYSVSASAANAVAHSTIAAAANRRDAPETTAVATDRQRGQPSASNLF